MDKRGLAILLFTEDISIIGPLREALINGFTDPAQLVVSSDKSELPQLVLQNHFDVILISDRNNLFFEEAARLVRSSCPSAPLICLSISIGEENVVELIRQGYCDFVHLNRLERLCYSILQATQQSIRQYNDSSKPVEIELKRIKEFLEEAQSVAHIGSWERDFRTNTYFWSDETYRIFGVQKDFFNLTSETIMAMRHPDDRQKAADVIAESLRGKSDSEYEYRIVRPNGELRHIHATRKIFYDESGEPVRGIGVIQDITERRQAELQSQQEELKYAVLQRETELLREKEKEYFEILDAASDGAFIRDFSSGTITFSDKWVQKRGLENVSPEEMEARNLDLIHPEDIHNLQDAREECFRNHRPMYEYEHRTISKNGNYIWIHGRVKVIYDENDMPIKLYGSCLDITDRKQMEEALRQSEALLRNIIESANNPIYMKDLHSRMVLCNSVTADLFGHDINQLIGKTDVEFMGSRKKTRLILNNDKRVIETGLPETFEELVPTKYGDRIFLSAKIPWKDSKGNIVGVIGVSHDITLQKNIEFMLRQTTEELTKKNKLITDFITNLSHELRTPLAIIMMQIELIKLSSADPINISRMLEVAWQNSLRLSRIINNILDISRAEGGYLEARLEKADIVDHIRNICGSVSMYAQSKSIELTFDSQLFCKYMQIDVEKVERILLNLLSNAIKYTPEGGNIYVSVRFRKRGDLILIVKDTGVGISSEKIETIFDRFVRVDTSLNRDNEGSGIGLALVKSLIEVLGGSITVRSELGKGSIFIVELPTHNYNRKTNTYKVQSLNLKNRVELELSDLIINSTI